MAGRAVDVPDLGNARVGGVVARQGHRDVAGHQFEQREHDERREQDDRDGLQQAAADDPSRTSPRHSALQPDVVVFRLAEEVRPVALHLLVHGDQFELEGERRHESVLHHQALDGRKSLAADLDTSDARDSRMAASSSGGTGALPPL